MTINDTIHQLQKRILDSIRQIKDPDTKLLTFYAYQASKKGKKLFREWCENDSKS